MVYYTRTVGYISPLESILKGTGFDTPIVSPLDLPPNPEQPTSNSEENAEEKV